MWTLLWCSYISASALLEQLDIESSDFVDEVLYQVHQSCRFPQLTSHLQIEQAWLVNNRVLEDSFNAARRRLKGGANTSSDANLGIGFYAVYDWSSVENIANNGIFPGNDQNTWLGKPRQGKICSFLMFCYLFKICPCKHAKLLRVIGVYALITGGMRYFAFSFALAILPGF